MEPETWRIQALNALVYRRARSAMASTVRMRLTAEDLISLESRTAMARTLPTVPSNMMSGVQ